jgi:hypothetical protein
MALKGMALKDLYPITYQRVMCDLDYYICPWDICAVTRALLDVGFQTSQRENELSYHIGFSNKKGALIEMHKSFVQTDSKYCNFSRYLEHRVRLDNGPMTWSVEDEYLFLLLHFIKHLTDAGAGIRLVLDIYLYQNKKTFNMAYVEETLRNFGLEAFYSRLQALMFGWFEGIPWQDEDVDMFSRMVLTSGVYGQSELWCANNFRTVMGTRSDRIGYIYRRLLPKQALMKINYPKAGRYKLLLPILWLHRLVSKATPKKVQISQELKFVLGRDLNQNDYTRFFK